MKSDLFDHDAIARLAPLLAKRPSGNASDGRQVDADDPNAFDSFGEIVSEILDCEGSASCRIVG